MAWAWSESWDPYAAAGDAILGYWDSGVGTAAANTLVAGRFSGSQAYSMQSGGVVGETKASNVNDSVHHIVVAFRQTATLTGTTLGLYFQLIDNVTNQCAVVFRSDGAMLLTAGGPAGTVLATYTGAVTAANTWTAFEIEVVVSNTVGGMRVRKNGNTSNDYDSFVSLGNLDTAATANNYANKLSIGMQTTVTAHQIDDLIWRSDASAVPWIGDVRIVARAPASDVQAQFTRVYPGTFTPYAATSFVNVVAGTSYFCAFSPTISGPLSAITLSIRAAYTGNIKCALFQFTGNVPGPVIQAATAAVNNPLAGNATFTFSPSVNLVAGTSYFVGFCFDSNGTSVINSSAATSSTPAFICSNVATGYAAFPANNPVTSTGGGANLLFSYALTSLYNYLSVAEAQQDGATSYVYSSNPGDNDLYSLAALSVTPQAVFGVTTRCFVQKSDAGARSGAVQLKSGSTTVNSGGVALPGGSWGWLYRTDVTDPAGGNWTPTSVNNLQIGPVVVS